MSMLFSIIAQIVHVGLMLLAAPALAGLIGWLDARLAGRLGPPLLLPWQDLLRLSRKTPAVPENASCVLVWAPAVALGATLCAAALTPSFTLGMALAPLADGLVIAGLLTIARAAATLGALDTGAATSGLAAQQTSALAVLTEPILLLVIFSLAAMAGSCNLEQMIGQQREAAMLPAAAAALAVISLLACVIADLQHPAHGLEGDLSGIDLAMARLSSWLRRIVWIDLIGGLFLPMGIAGADARLQDWGFGLICWALKLVIAAGCLSGIRAMTGSILRRNMPDLLRIAALLALLATVIVLASADVA